MKIRKSKQELARIISENGGWRVGAESAAQCKSDNAVSFYRDAPYRDGDCWWGEHLDGRDISQDKLIENWHQCILSRAEYFHLYPAPDADGWIEWKGGKCPLKTGELVDIRYRDGEEVSGAEANECESDAGAAFWRHDDFQCDIIAYRLHKPEQAKTVGADAIGVAESTPEAKPTIEQLAADYRNAKDCAERKQQEADAAKEEAEAKLADLVAAGKALGLNLSVAAPEPEPVITDWRDLRVGDIIEYVDGDIKNKIGMTGPIVELAPNANDGMFVRLKCDNGQNKGRLGWPKKWRFIRRP